VTGLGIPRRSVLTAEADTYRRRAEMDIASICVRGTNFLLVLSSETELDHAARVRYLLAMADRIYCDPTLGGDSSIPYPSGSFPHTRHSSCHRVQPNHVIGADHCCDPRTTEGGPETEVTLWRLHILLFDPTLAFLRLGLLSATWSDYLTRTLLRRGVQTDRLRAAMGCTDSGATTALSRSSMGP
jgi:hypothetical protein